jgi:TetR/AcrR family tetracycline transcriptional repressor
MKATKEVAMALDRAQVVGAALELLDEVGLDGLTMRELAGRLDVRAPALYWHFRNKRELIDEMAVAMVAAAMPAVRALGPDENWADWVAERGRQLRRVLLSRRDSALLLSSTRPAARQWEPIERQIDNLTRAGLSPADALRSMLVLSRYVAGFVMEEQAERRAAECAQTEGGAAYLHLLETRYPSTVGAIRAVGDPQSIEVFEYGLQLIINGMRQALAVPTG